MATCGAIKVSVFGHSFVKRLNYFINDNPAYSNLGFPRSEFSVGVYGIGGLNLFTDNRLHRYDEKIRNSDILILDLGSNCLCDPTIGVFTFVNRLLNYIETLQTDFGVKVVALTQILHREKEPYHGYNNKVVIVNEYIDINM